LKRHSTFHLSVICAEHIHSQLCFGIHGLQQGLSHRILRMNMPDQEVAPERSWYRLKGIDNKVEIVQSPRGSSPACSRNVDLQGKPAGKRPLPDIMLRQLVQRARGALCIGGSQKSVNSLHAPPATVQCNGWPLPTGERSFTWRATGSC
jgi:hypothetical protein